MNFKNLIGGGLAGVALMVCSAAQAIVIDDFNVTTTSAVSDATLNATASTTPSIIDGANIVMDGAAGWSRTLSASLTAGADFVETIVCGGCQVGHFNAQNPATGIGEFIYAGTGVAFDGTAIAFDYNLDLAGSVVDILLSNGDVLSSGPLAASLPGWTTVTINFGAGDYSNITGLTVRVTGTQAADFSIDNLRTVPVPMPLALMALGLLGLGLLRRKATV